VTDPIAAAERELRCAAGGYLRNVVREPAQTCAVCATPVRGYPRCLPCDRARATSGLADQVVALCYAIQGAQSGFMLRHYKDNPAAAVRAQHARIISRLLYLGVTLHERCLETVTARPVTLRLTIPSSRDRPETHPFFAIARKLNAVNDTPLLKPARGSAYDRSIDADNFALKPDVDLRGLHILLLDDTWTTGGHAQSAALTVRRAGAETVSVLVIGRWLSPRHARNGDFVAERLRDDYDPRRCPVTGAQCPQ
jgi:predicted amidophosphoribosyltransferase